MKDEAYRDGFQDWFRMAAETVAKLGSTPDSVADVADDDTGFVASLIGAVRPHAVPGTIHVISAENNGLLLTTLELQLKDNDLGIGADQALQRCLKRSKHILKEVRYHGAVFRDLDTDSPLFAAVIVSLVDPTKFAYRPGSTHEITDDEIQRWVRQGGDL